MNSSADIFAVPDDIIEHVASKTVYFGHQSVGYNILDGVAKLTDGIVLVDLSDGQTQQVSPAFFHSAIGENRNPESKLNAFAGSIETGFSGKPDIAFMKFCYVDFDEKSDVNGLFANYREVFSRLGKQYPDIQFIHLTVPLVAREGGLKNTVKRMLGRDVYTDTENIRRQEFNALLRSVYKDVFDLARLESTRIDGKVLKHTRKGYTYYSLVPGYTRDGGHLNDTGARIVARELLFFLSKY